ncbi:hypothetical protein J6590_072726 [Homalodisca vitripennis]|nr:hypothetical protein J6590_072726 [Homalodisca vitripennis]
MTKNLFFSQGQQYTQQGSLLAGLYLSVESTTGHSKNRCVTSIWANLWMSRSGTSLIANVEILGFMGNSIGLVYCESMMMSWRDLLLVREKTMEVRAVSMTAKGSDADCPGSFEH